MLPALLLLTACGDLTGPVPPTPTSGEFAPASASDGSVVAQQASPGTYHTCLLFSDGTIKCWGHNRYGQALSVRRAVTGAFVQVSAGGYHTCALRDDGVVECWGRDNWGQTPATKQAMEGSFTQLQASAGHNCALRSDGIVECWGLNDQGQAPAIRSASNGVFTQITVHSGHSCALRSDGAVECWGGNAEGKAPTVRTASVGTFIQVTAGLMHSCGLRSDGGIDCWGNNTYDHLMAPSETGIFTAIEAGTHHTCALRTDGTASCWGLGHQGAQPPRHAAVGTYLRLEAGYAQTCAIRSDTYAECWGNNANILNAPATPTDFETIATPSGIDLGWRAADDAEWSFRVNRRAANADGTWGRWKYMGSTSRHDPWYADTDVGPGTTYQYRVRACNPTGCSDFRVGSIVSTPGGQSASSADA